MKENRKNILQRIINKIEDCLNIGGDYKNDINNFENLLSLLEFDLKDFTLDDYMYLIKYDNKINKLLEQIVNKNYTFILNKGINSLPYSQELINFVDAYCIANDIEIDKSLDNIEIEDIVYDIDYNEDSLKQYIMEISKIPLLSRMEEIELFKRIKQGDKNAFNRVVESNLRLVVSFAKNYKKWKIPVLDLIQNGNEGLIKAVEMYDFSTGVKFSTYARYWIRLHMDELLPIEAKSIRLPIHQFFVINKIKKTINNITIRENREPEIEEIAEYLNISITDLQVLINYVDNNIVSLNQKIDENDDNEYGNTYFMSSEDAERRVINTFLRKDLLDVLDKCKIGSKEKDILLRRYGFVNNREYTLEEIGDMHDGLSKERIRVIINTTLNNIRSSLCSENLMSYAGDVGIVSHELQALRKKDTRCNVMDYSIIDNIYTFFNKFSRESVDISISWLTKKDKEMLYTLYGDDLENMSYDFNANYNIKEYVLKNVFSTMNNNLNYISSEVERKIYKAEDEFSIDLANFLRIRRVQLLISREGLKKIIILLSFYGKIDSELEILEYLKSKLKLTEEEINEVLNEENPKLIAKINDIILSKNKNKCRKRVMA